MLTPQDKVATAAILTTCAAVTAVSIGMSLNSGDSDFSLFDPVEQTVLVLDNAPSSDLALDEALGIEPIVNVKVPENISFVIDPFEVNGRGQIFSDDLPVTNFSNVDVIVKIKSLHYTFKNDTDFVCLDQPYDYFSHSTLKAVNMLLKSDVPEFEDFVITNRVDEAPSFEFYLAASTYDETNTWMSLNEGSEMKFSLGGTVSEAPDIPWESDDIILTIDFDVTPIFPEPPAPAPTIIEMPNPLEMDELTSGDGLLVEEMPELEFDPDMTEPEQFDGEAAETTDPYADVSDETPVTESGTSDETPVTEPSNSDETSVTEPHNSDETPVTEPGNSDETPAPESGSSDETSAPESGSSDESSAPESGGSDESSEPTEAI